MAIQPQLTEPSFKMFSQLPAETRNQIFKSAIPSPSEIPIIRVSAHKFHDGISSPQKFFKLKTDPSEVFQCGATEAHRHIRSNSLLRVCRDSRFFFLESFNKTLPASNGGVIRFPAQTIVYIDNYPTVSTQGPQSPGAIWQESAGQSFDFTAVCNLKKIAVPSRMLDYPVLSIHHFCDYFEHFRDLETLVFYDDFLGCRSFHLPGILANWMNISERLEIEFKMRSLQAQRAGEVPAGAPKVWVVL
jgi:hypothetical protein